MATVKLETERGELVTFADLPPFRTMPAVITWGLRTFVAQDLDADGPAVYREVFAVAVADPNTPRREP